MVDTTLQLLRLGEKKKKKVRRSSRIRRKRRNYRTKIQCPHLLRRAAIIILHILSRSAIDLDNKYFGLAQMTAYKIACIKLNWL